MAERMDVEQLLTSQVIDDLGPDHLATGAVLIVETLTPQGTGLRFYTAGVTTWHAHGMVSSVARRLEHRDLNDWLGDD